MTIKDDRNEIQKQTFTTLVIATDEFMSGWGHAKNGRSVCAWACDTYEKVVAIEKWVKRRPEMKNVRVSLNPKYRPQAKHFHIYVVKDNHPALEV